MTENPSSSERLLPARAVADRYSISLRTLSRWVAHGVIPAPNQIIRDRRYWKAATLEAADRERTIAAGRSRPVPRHAAQPTP